MKNIMRKSSVLFYKTRLLNKSVVKQVHVVPIVWFDSIIPTVKHVGAVSQQYNILVYDVVQKNVIK